MNKANELRDITNQAITSIKAGKYPFTQSFYDNLVSLAEKAAARGYFTLNDDFDEDILDKLDKDYLYELANEDGFTVLRINYDDPTQRPYVTLSWEVDFYDVGRNPVFTAALLDAPAQDDTSTSAPQPYTF